MTSSLWTASSMSAQVGESFSSVDRNAVLHLRDTLAKRLVETFPLLIVEVIATRHDHVVERNQLDQIALGQIGRFIKNQPTVVDVSLQRLHRVHIEKRDDGVFRMAPDRVISVIDPEARHGHKTAARGFDGYKGHIAVDPDSEIITATAVTAGNVGDAEPAEQLLEDVLATVESRPSSETAEAEGETPAIPQASSEPVEVYGDASYGTAELVEKLEAAAIEPNVKVQLPTARRGMFSQDDFQIDLDAGTVPMPGGAIGSIAQDEGRLR